MDPKQLQGRVQGIGHRRPSLGFQAIRCLSHSSPSQRSPSIGLQAKGVQAKKSKPSYGCCCCLVCCFTFCLAGTRSIKKGSRTRFLYHAIEVLRIKTGALPDAPQSCSAAGSAAPAGVSPAWSCCCLVFGARAKRCPSRRCPSIGVQAVGIQA